MGRLEFFVHGSSSEPYRVVLEKNAENLNGFCTCGAGSNGQASKHVLRILSGNPEGLASVFPEQLMLAVNWTVGTDVELALKELAVAEDHYEAAKRSLSAAKKALSASLRK